MPNQQNVNMTEACKRFDEAIRDIPKYQLNSKEEPNALLAPEMDVLNGIYFTNPCMNHRKNTSHISKGLRMFIKEKIGKEPTKDTAVCTCIVTMPKTFMKAHYKIAGEEGEQLELTDKQYMLLEKYFSEEKMNSYEEAEVKKIKKSLVHPQWTKEEIERIHQFFMAVTSVYCKQAGIKGPKVYYKKNEDGTDYVNERGEKEIDHLDFEGSDVLWSISHFSESWPHLHLAYASLAYIQDKEPAVKYRNDLEIRKAKVQLLIDLGIDKVAAEVLIPKVKRPYALDGDLNRSIESDEAPVCSTVRRFRNTYLRELNTNLEKGLEESFGIQAEIANGAGGKLDPQKTKKNKRFKGSTDEKAYKLLLDEKERISEEMEATKKEIEELRAVTSQMIGPYIRLYMDAVSRICHIVNQNKRMELLDEMNSSFGFFNMTVEKSMEMVEVNIIPPKEDQEILLEGIKEGRTFCDMLEAEEYIK